MANTEYRTVLQYVSAILESMDSDTVASCGDTEESRAVTGVLRRCYESLLTTDLPEHYSLFNLIEDADAGDDPTILLRPIAAGTDPDIASILWIKYDCQTSTDTQAKYEKIEFMPLEQFLEMSDKLDLDATEVVETAYATGLQSADSITFRYRNDIRPHYWTTPDDTTIIFDSYDIAEDLTGLQASKTKCYGKLNVLWRRDLDLTNSIQAATMDAIQLRLDPESQLILENKAIALAWAEKKLTQHGIAAAEARRGQIRNKKQKQALDQNYNPMNDFPNFGRRGRSTGSKIPKNLRQGE